MFHCIVMSCFLTVRIGIADGSKFEVSAGQEALLLSRFVTNVIMYDLRWNHVLVMWDEDNSINVELVRSLNNNFVKTSTATITNQTLLHYLVDDHTYKFGHANILTVVENPKKFDEFIAVWSNDKLKSEKERWLIYSNKGPTDICSVNSIDNKYLRYLKFDADTEQFELYQCNYGKVEVHVILEPSPSFNNPVFGKKRTALNLKGKKLLIGTYGFNFPFMIDGKRDGKYYTPDDGLDYRILQGFAKVLNFTYDIIHVQNGKWGSEFDNGTWNGMIGMLERKEVDIAMSGLSRTTARLKVADFTHTYLFNQLTFAAIAPQEVSKVQAPIVPFQQAVWLCYLGSLILTALFLTLMASFDHKYLHKTKRSVLKEQESSHRFSVLTTLGNNLWYMYGAALMQAGITPKHTGVKILISAWWLLVITLLASYGAMLTSFLTYPGKEEALDTMVKLSRAVRDDTVKCGAQEGTSHYDLFAKAKSGFFKEIGDNMKSDPSNAVHTIKDGLAKVLEEKSYIYIGGYLRVRANMEDESQFTFSKEPFNFYTYNVALQKGFPYVMEFDSTIRKMKEAGLIDKWLEDLMNKRKKRRTYVSVERPIQLKDLQGAFLIIGFGYLVAVIAFGIEQGTKWYQEKKQEVNAFDE